MMNNMDRQTSAPRLIMLRICTLLIILTSVFTQAHGQRPDGGMGMNPEDMPTLSGTVLDENGQAIPFAAIAIYRMRDSSLFKGGASDGTGKFAIQMPPGRYYGELRFLSYEAQVIDPFFLKREDMDLGEFTMKMSAEQLDAVVVEAEKSDMELHMDKRVFNVEQNMVSRGSNAAQLLDNLPSVNVDVEGNVALRGSQNVRILIDGRPSGLVGLSSTDALRQLQSNQIEKVEVITNPSARYDAEGEVGIINIVLKEDRRDGFNGSFELRAGEPANHGGSANLNYRTGGTTFFGSYGAFYRRRPGSGASYQTFTYPDTSFSYDRQEEHNRGGWNQMFRAGVDQKIGKYTNVSVSGLYRRSDGDHFTELDYLDYAEDGELVRAVKRREDEEDVDETKEVTLNFQRKFKQKERKWTADVRYMESGEIETAIIEEFSDDLDYIPLNQRTYADELQKLIFFNSDYIHPIGENGKFETGIRGSLKTLDLEFTVEDQLSDASYQVNPLYDNFLIYKEDIYAAYAMFGNKKDAFSYQLGMRAEYSDISTELTKTGDFNPRDYLNFFPSVHLSYEVKKETFLQLSYSRRIRRPNHWWLVPFFGFTDARNFRSGNPDLDPMYINSMEVSVLRRSKKGSIMGSLYYRRSTGNMERIILSDADGFTRSLPVNLGTGDSYGLEANSSLRVQKWWNINGNLNVFYSKTRGTYEGVNYSAEAFAWNGRLNSRWNFKKLYSIQTNFNYRSGANTNQGRRLAVYSWDAAAAVDVLNSKGTLSFNARDILNTRKRRMETIGENFTSEAEFQWMSRSFTLTFNYRINQKKQRPERSGGFDQMGGEGM